MLKFGIDSIGIKLPSYAIHAKDVASLQGISDKKVTAGLGCHMMGLCLDQETVVDLAVEAAKRALSRFDGAIEDIGLIAVGTETAIDEARPLSAWVAEALHLEGHIRSYEVKHACYAGTLALKQAVEWKATQPPSSKKVGLVIAADICTYAPGHPAEMTQGAGAIAFVVGKGKVASIDLRSYPYSAPCFDFWRPKGHDFPIVNAPESLNAYIIAVKKCYDEFFREQPYLTLTDFYALCFHTPFPKMVLRAFKQVGCQLRIPSEQQEEIVETRIRPFMDWNSEIGNSYTASLWINTVRALHTASMGGKLACFSYGSGFGAELLILERQEGKADWAQDVHYDLEHRTLISLDDYRHWRMRCHHEHEKAKN